MDGVPNLQDLVPDSVNSSLQARTQVQKMQETASQFSTLERELKCKEHEFLRSQQLWFLESPEHFRPTSGGLGAILSLFQVSYLGVVMTSFNWRFRGAYGLLKECV